MNAACQRVLVSGSLLVLFLAPPIGCGGSGTTVEGNVTFDGQPVEQGLIVFEPANGTGPVAGGKILNGKYRLGDEEGVAPGDVIVRISAVRPTGRKIEAGPPAPAGSMVDEIRQFIPPAYNERSKLTAQVAAGNGTQNFELKSQPLGR